MKALTVRLEDAPNEALETYAARIGLSPAVAIRSLVYQYLLHEGYLDLYPDGWRNLDPHHSQKPGNRTTTGNAAARSAQPSSTQRDLSLPEALLPASSSTSEGLLSEGLLNPEPKNRAERRRKKRGK